MTGKLNMIYLSLVNMCLHRWSETIDNASFDQTLEATMYGSEKVRFVIHFNVLEI